MAAVSFSNITSRAKAGEAAVQRQRFSKISYVEFANCNPRPLLAPRHFTRRRTSPVRRAPASRTLPVRSGWRLDR
ncbi:hypothetical protein SPHINGO391_470337 [Sphingomonas aurantiaca]|uniref:Uncharacterized protein n=1 Tax=Sphingomonas aurantiaca TaxID=185949 RepID=A0A5E7ZT53_9SPHN|nr:hypothetical protein SPHINGO391_470337 [Sphingomonas aurantiaca]